MPSGITGPIYIIGPTAAGKTQLGIALARELGGEIINADSRQVYQFMDIGTSKPTPEERSVAPHHLFDLLPPSENFSLGEFLTRAKAAIDEISDRGAPPIVVGGTGQYVWALTRAGMFPKSLPTLSFARSWKLRRPSVVRCRFMNVLGRSIPNAPLRWTRTI